MKLNITSPSKLEFVVLALCCVSTAHAIIERLFIAINAHLVDTRLDPLTNPNSCSTHVHSVFGSVEFASTISPDDFNDPNWQDDTGKADQTTSHIIPNRSMYWAPSLYIYNPVNQLYYIVPSFARTYYRIEYRDNISTIKPIPQYLQLIAGDASRKTEWSTSDVHDDIRWTVRSNRQRTNSIEHGDWRYLRNNPRLVAVEDQLEMNILFPNCLQVEDDGVTPVISSSDFRRHASYTSRTHTCPAEFPYHIPTVNVEVRYDLKAMRELLGRDVVDNLDNWNLSTLDQTGAGAHADFVSGWPEELLANAIQYCRRSKDITGQGRCLVEKYNGEFSNNPERRHVELSATTMLPDEAISPVRRIPRGPCPKFV